jgi:hypothetical protein
MLEDAMSAVHERTYDQAAVFWQKLYAEFQKALHDKSLYTLRPSKIERAAAAAEAANAGIELEDEVHICSTC